MAVRSSPSRSPLSRRKHREESRTWKLQDICHWLVAYLSPAPPLRVPNIGHREIFQKLYFTIVKESGIVSPCGAGAGEGWSIPRALLRRWLVPRKRVETKR